MVIRVGCYLRRENAGLLLTANALIAIRRLWLAKEKSTPERVFPFEEEGFFSLKTNRESLLLPDHESLSVDRDWRVQSSKNEETSRNWKARRYPGTLARASCYHMFETCWSALLGEQVLSQPCCTFRK